MYFFNDYHNSYEIKVFYKNSLSEKFLAENYIKMRRALDIYKSLG